MITVGILVVSLFGVPIVAGFGFFHILVTDEGTT